MYFPAFVCFNFATYLVVSHLFQHLKIKEIDFQTILGTQLPTCLFLLLMSLGVGGLNQEVCWGWHASQKLSIFSENPFSLYNNFKHRINIWSCLQRLYLVFVFNCSIVFCRNRTKFCLVSQLFFHLSSYLPGFQWGDQQIVVPDWF